MLEKKAFEVSLIETLNRNLTVGLSAIDKLEDTFSWVLKFIIG